MLVLRCAEAVCCAEVCVCNVCEAACKAHRCDLFCGNKACRRFPGSVVPQHSPGLVGRRFPVYTMSPDLGNNVACTCYTVVREDPMGSMSWLQRLGVCRLPACIVLRWRRPCRCCAPRVVNTNASRNVSTSAWQCTNRVSAKRAADFNHRLRQPLRARGCSVHCVSWPCMRCKAALTALRKTARSCVSLYTTWHIRREHREISHGCEVACQERACFSA